MLPDATTDIPAWAGKDKDEPFDVKKFLESRAAPADNAAPLYFEAMAEISPEWISFIHRINGRNDFRKSRHWRRIYIKSVSDESLNQKLSL